MATEKSSTPKPRTRKKGKNDKPDPLPPDSNPRFERNGHVPLSERPIIPIQDRCATALEVNACGMDWLWEPFLPDSVPVLLVGDTGAGKSTFLSAAIAAVSGGPWFQGSRDRPDHRVLLYNSEEDPARIVKPRLEAQGAKLGNIYFGDVGLNGSSMARLSLPLDFDKLERRILGLRVKLLCIDPITSYLSPGLDVRDAQQVRALLDALGLLAFRTGCDIMYTTHYRKSREGSPLDRVIGSAAWTQVPRVVLAFGIDPDTPTQRVMATAKNSLVQNLKSIRYSLVPHGKTVKFVAGEECTLTAEDLGQGGMTPPERDALADAVAYLLDALATEERPAKDIVKTATESGIALGTLRRAKTKAGITSHPIGPNGQRYVVWRMPCKKPPE